MSRKICVSAYNIHQGGGKVILLAFLKEKISENYNLKCFIDERLSINFEEFKDVIFIKVKPNLISRINAEYGFKKISSEFDIFYFLGNLPPLFKLKCKVVLFLQNRLIISKPYINKLSIKTILRSVLEITWFKLFLKHIDTVEVQTPSMKKAFLKNSPTAKVKIHNYIDYDELTFFKRKFESLHLQKEKNSFIYVASIDPHKNIQNLILAFAMLKLSVNDYCLYLTINKNSNLIKVAHNLNVNVKCLETTDRESVLKQVYCSEYLIFPSLIESLGLPMIEAKYMGTTIISSNLDFVFDACTPHATFDPLVVNSIAEEIKKAIKN